MEKTNEQRALLIQDKYKGIIDLIGNIGMPIVGDLLYGNGTDTNQLKLHAKYLSFNHPETGERLEFFSEVPF